jgi:vacuolar-type H+-ATPase subunit H
MVMENSPREREGSWQKRAESESSTILGRKERNTKEIAFKISSNELQHFTRLFTSR